MARNWQYPRWRRLLMQSAMWVILGGTVGLAALLDRHQRQTSSELLGPSLDCGPIQLQLPAHWRSEYSDVGMLTAIESRGFPPRRLLQITVAPPAPPDLLDQLLRKENPTDPTQSIAFPGVGASGNLYIWKQPLPGGGVLANASSPMQGVIIATAVLANGPQVTLRLEHLEPNAQSLDLQEDILLLRRIAATVEPAPPDDDPSGK